MKDLVDQAFDKARPVAVLLGGTSAEREISLKSGRAVSETLRELGLDVREIDPATQPIAGVSFRPDEVCFIALHGTYGEDGTVQRELAARKVPFTGCPAHVAELTANKWMTSNLVAQRAKICRTPKQRAISRNDSGVTGWDSFPAVVKPARQGSSIGLAFVRNTNELADAIAVASAVCEDADREVAVETYVRGDEYTVAVLNRHAFVPIAVHKGSALFDFDSKYVSDESEFKPLNGNAELGQKLRDAAIEVCQLCETTGLVRVDLIVSRNELYFLEVNTIPGMTERSLAPLAAAAEGLDFGFLCLAMLADAITKNPFDLSLSRSRP